MILKNTNKFGLGILKITCVYVIIKKQVNIKF